MVKKSLLLVLIVIALFLVACTPEIQSDDDQPAVRSTPRTTTTPDDSGTTAEKETAKVPIPTQEISAEAKKILEAHSKIKSVRYIRGEGKSPQFFYVKGNQFKKEVPRPSKYASPSENYDHVYVDRNNKESYAYCEDLSTIACPLENRNSAYELNFEDEDEILALDHLENIAYVEIIGKEDIDNRHTTVLKFVTQDGQQGKVWMDTFYGFVFQYQLLDNNNQVIEMQTYTRAAFNNLKDSDVNLPEGVQIT